MGPDLSTKMIHCCILVLVWLEFTRSCIKQTKMCKQITQGRTGLSPIDQKICQENHLCQTTMEPHCLFATALGAGRILTWCCKQIRIVEYEHILRHVNNLDLLHILFASDGVGEPLWMPLICSLCTYYTGDR